MLKRSAVSTDESLGKQSLARSAPWTDSNERWGQKRMAGKSTHQAAYADHLCRASRTSSPQHKSKSVLRGGQKQNIALAFCSLSELLDVPGAKQGYESWQLICTQAQQAKFEGEGKRAGYAQEHKAAHVMAIRIMMTIKMLPNLPRMTSATAGGVKPAGQCTTWKPGLVVRAGEAIT